MKSVPGSESEVVPLGVILPTYRRIEDLEVTLRRIGSCSPGPCEVVVGVDYDGGVEEVAALLSRLQLSGSYFEAAERLGPGGVRRRLYETATSEWLLSLDDDSHPIDDDFFREALRLVDCVPAECAVVDIALFEIGDSEVELGSTLRPGFHFHGGAALIRREAVLKARNYPRIHSAYGIEETVMSLFLHDLGYCVFWTNQLRIFHNTDGARRGSLECRTAEARNGFLLTVAVIPAVMFVPFLIRAFISAARMLNWNLLDLGRTLANVICLIPSTLRERQRVSVRSAFDLLFLRFRN